MPTDAYTYEPVGDLQHRHPWLTQHEVDLAKVVTRHRPRKNGLAVVISGDTRLKCCGRLVSELIPGNTYPDARPKRGTP